MSTHFYPINAAIVQLPVLGYGGCACPGGRVEVAMPPLPEGVELETGGEVVEGAPYRPEVPPLTIPPPPGPIPMTGSVAVLQDQVEVQTYQANWAPNGNRLTFAAFHPWAENTPNIQYTWNVYANMYCNTISCSYEHILGMGLMAYHPVVPNQPAQQVISFDPPNLDYTGVPGGITLDISVVAYNPATQESATGVYSLPAAGRPVCKCSDVPVLNRYLSTLTSLNGPGGVYQYNAANVATTNVVPELPDDFDPNNPLDPSPGPGPGPGGNVSGQSTKNKSSPALIGGISAAVAVVVIGAAFITFFIVRKHRVEAPKEGQTTEVAPPPPEPKPAKREKRSRRPEGITLESTATSAQAPVSTTPKNPVGPSPKGDRRV